MTAGLGLGAVPQAATAVGASARQRLGRTAQGWQQAAVPPGAEAARLLKAAAAGPDCAWAVGEQARNGSAPGRPLAVHWDGAAWSHTDLTHLGFAGAVVEVAGTSPEAAWAIGGDTGDGSGHLLRWDGATWQDADFPGRGDAGTSLSAVTVADDGRAWAAGVHDGRARLLHWDGRVWRWLPPLPEGTAALWNVHLAPDGSVWVSRDAIARWDHRSWTVLPVPAGIRLTVTGLLPVAPDDAWAVGAAFGPGGPPGKPPSVVLARWNGTEWLSDREALPFTVGALHSIVGDARGRPALISGWDFWDGTRTHYLRRSGDGWTGERGPLAEGLTPMMTDLATVPGTDTVWAVGTTTRYSTQPPAQLRIERYG
ncbi:hypothetical protein [Streptomyces armeniacus]|uniref:hypothetical protein n=1 Tax=Streptomyces armeniacus TaxID=83291 RepID=UPI001FE6E3C1|nr:hypothetical protein [Streptomyces armeniacus]